MSSRTVGATQRNLSQRERERIPVRMMVAFAEVAAVEMAYILEVSMAEFAEGSHVGRENEKSQK